MKKILEKTFAQVLIAYCIADVFGLGALFIIIIGDSVEHISLSPEDAMDVVQAILRFLAVGLYALVEPFILSFEAIRGLTQTEERTSGILNDPFYYLSLVATLASIGCFYLVHKKVKRPFRRIASFAFLFGVWLVAGAYLFINYIGE